MRPPISFRCSECRARIKAPWQLFGQSRACPGCGNHFIVRPSVPEDAGPVLLLLTAGATNTEAPYRLRFA
jgi:hypothetical protein